MQCTGNLIDPVGQQICLAHALQQAIIDTLYKHILDENYDTEKSSSETDDVATSLS